MNDKTRYVFAGWLMLNEQERGVLREKIAQYYESDEYERRRLVESYRADLRKLEMQTGPLGKVCPCCGR